MRRRTSFLIAATFVFGASVAGSVALSDPSIPNVNAAVPTTCNGLTVTLPGTDGPDLLIGTTGANVVASGDGDDVIIALDGNDTVCSGAGNDTVALGAGGDFLDAATGSDRGYGEAGNDVCRDVELVISCTNTNTPPPTTTTTAPPATTTTTQPPTTTTTVPPTGHFATLPVGATLPTEAFCAAAVRQMTENRPNNTPYNNTRGTAPNATYPRVTGNFVGETDEIIQWAACKWGIDEDWVRAQIVAESFWDQRVVGDTDPVAGGAVCTSHGLGQVRRCYHDNAFENAVQSSAYNLDYTYAVWRSCFNGEMTWLNTVEHGAEYQAGDQLGCFGVWFAGRYRTPPAIQYMTAVQGHFNNQPWKDAGFPPAQPTGPGPTTTTTQPATTTTTQAPTTTTTQPATTTTTIPSGAAFLETFTGNTGMERFRKGVYQRGPDHDGFTGASGGTWQGDHGMNCSPPSYTSEGLRTLQWDPDDSMAQRVATSFFGCTDHMMTSMGDVDFYSVTYFLPDQTFTDVSRVCFDVNLTNMGNRTWFKVGIVPAGEPEVFSDVQPASNLPDHGPNTVTMEWNTPGATSQTQVDGHVFGGTYTAGTDKATRYAHCMTDNGNGTITAWQDRGTGRITTTVNGSFPNGPATVVFQQHSYTPDKSEFPFQRPAYTFHWDNISVT